MYTINISHKKQVFDRSIQNPKKVQGLQLRNNASLYQLHLLLAIDPEKKKNYLIYMTYARILYCYFEEFV